MNILLTAINAKFIHTNISLRYLKKATAHLPVETSLYEVSINEERDQILEGILLAEPDLVAFSVYLWNFQLVQELSCLLKKVRPNLPILYGGPEVSYDSLHHLQILDGEYIIRGEGEKTYEDFIGSLLHGKNLHEVAGLTFREGDTIFVNPPREKMPMEEVPYPYEEGEDLRGKLAYMEASRGCPYQCSYCLSSAERDLRFLPLAEVKERIEKLLFTGASVVKFIDRTFNIHPEAKDIWAYLISLDTAVTFHFEIAPDLIKEEHLALLATAPPGRIQFEVGIQSTKKEVLQSIQRYIGFTQVLEKLQRLASLDNIHCHMDLIAGLPYDTLETFKNSFNDVYPLQPGMLQLGFLKIIKGTPMEKDAKGFAMAYSPYPPYEVLETKWMSYETLRHLHKVEDALERYYNSGRFAKTLSYVLADDKDPFAFYEALGLYLEERGQGRSLGLKDQFLFLRDFALEYKKPRNQEDVALVLNELLKFDWLSTNKKQYVPEFLQRNHEKNQEARKDLLKNLRMKIHVEIFKMDLWAYFDQGTMTFCDTPVVYDLDSGEIIKI